MPETRFTPEFIAENEIENTEVVKHRYEADLITLAEQEFALHQEQLGRGQSATVWFGSSPSFKKDLCFKTIHTAGLEAHGLRNEFDYHQQFQQAGVRVPRLIAHVAGVGQRPFGADGFLAMERIKGRTLEQEIAYRQAMQEKFTVAELQSIIADATEQIERAHAANLYHRDIHLNNVMLNDEGKIVLIDFGKAKHALSAEDDLDIYRGTAIRGGNRIPVGFVRDEAFIGQFSERLRKLNLIEGVGLDK